MKPQWHFYSSKTRYTRLFIDLIIIFLLSPLANFSPIFDSLISLLFLCAILLAIDVISLPVRVVILFRIVAAAAFVADILVFPNSPNLTAFASLFSYICYSLFLIPAILAIGLRILNEERVNQDVIRGGICLYLLLGVLWFFFYQIIYFFDANGFSIPNDFSIPKTASETNLLLFYFSFTTLTTLGYGNIAPVNSFAMMLANAEALIGQLYPAIFIAKLVSLYSEN